MIEEVLPQLFRLKISLPKSPLKDLNSYVLVGQDRHLVIDTGFNTDQCFDAMTTGLGTLGIDLSRTDFMLTHMHSDHTGLAARLATPESRIFIGRADAPVFDDGIDWSPIVEYAVRHGFEREELSSALASHPGIRFRPLKMPPLNRLDDNDRMDVGRYRLRCISTPGHTKGHMCLFDENARVLISGDHVLHDITPHIESWSPDYDALGLYLQSLDKVRSLPVDLVLPGHRNAFSNLPARVDQLARHHRQRLAEVLAILARQPATAYETAAEMTWDIRADSFDQFPVAQKWFAVGEALAHLRHLETTGVVDHMEKGGLTIFRVTEKSRQ